MKAEPVQSHFYPEEKYIGGFSPNDGTIDFYGRVRSLLSPDSVVLDIGAGRGGWFESDDCDYRKSVRTLKGHAKEVIGADVDPAVLENRSTDRNLLINGGTIELPSESVDIVIADYVLEHVDDPGSFAQEIKRILKPGGYFCARTPHKWHYISLLAKMVKNAHHSRIIRGVQPNRADLDIFPTKYKMNTVNSLVQNFEGFRNATFMFRGDPAYFWGRKAVFQALLLMHRVLPSIFVGTMFVFLRKED